MTALAGVVRYEYRMAIRRWGVWVACALSVVPFISVSTDGGALLSSVPVWELAGSMAIALNYWMPVVAGIAIADRLPRDGKTGVRELLRATPLSNRDYVLGKYLGVVSAASAVVEDPALELQFAAPRAPWHMLLERLALLLALVGLAALTFQAYLAPLGGVAGRQLVWLTPTLALMALGSLGALATVQGTGGALLAGLMWILQLLLRGWFMASRWARYLFLFLGERWPEPSPALESAGPAGRGGGADPRLRPPARTRGTLPVAGEIVLPATDGREYACGDE